MFHLSRRGLALLFIGLLTLLFVAPQSTTAAGEWEATLLAEGEKRQVIEFNPNAALQKRIFADRFVPNSAEFRLTLDGVTFAGQRAEHLANGTVRVYFARVGDWANVAFVQRGQPGAPFALAMLQAGEKAQIIEFNPNAALQKRIFTDGFVPNSPEFRTQNNGRQYAAQRAEHLGNGRVRVYYAVVGNWGQVSFAQRGALPAQPTVTISPTSGPSGTKIAIEVRGFPAQRPIAVKIGPEYSEFGQEIASGWTDANGAFSGQGFMTVGAGRWIVGAHTSAPGPQAWAVSQPFVVTSAPQPRLTISPTSGPENTVIGIEVNGFPPQTALQVLAGPAEGGHAEVIARGQTNHLGNFATRAPISPIKGNRLAIRAVTVEGRTVQATAEFNITRGPTVSISPNRGPAGTIIQIIARGFPANTPVTVYAAPQNSEGTPIMRGQTDSNGTFTTQYRIQGAAGMRWGFSAVGRNDFYAVSDWFTITG